MMATVAGELHLNVFSMGSSDRAYIDGDYVTFAEGDSQPVVQLMLDVGDEALTITFDAYHLTEFRTAVTKAERWVKANTTRTA
jgi:hypothetical protein